jgi:hypothetical protein
MSSESAVLDRRDLGPGIGGQTPAPQSFAADPPTPAAPALSIGRIGAAAADDRPADEAACGVLAFLSSRGTDKAEREHLGDPRAYAHDRGSRAGAMGVPGRRRCPAMAYAGRDVGLPRRGVNGVEVDA